MRQVGLIQAGCQQWTNNLCATLDDRFVYCSTLAVYVHRLSDFSLEHVLIGHDKVITALSRCGTGNLVVTASADCSMRVWDTSSGKEVTLIEMDQFKPNCIAANPHDSNMIVCGGKKGYLRVYDQRNGKFKFLHLMSDLDVTRLVFNSRKNGQLLCSMQDGSIVVADVAINKVVRTIKKETAPVIDIKFDPLSPNYFLVAYDNGKMFLCDIEANDDSLVVQSYDRQGAISCFTWVHNNPGSFYTSDARTGAIRLWNVSQRTPQKIEKIRKVGFQEFIAFPFSSTRYLCSFTDGRVGVYDTKHKKFERLIQTGHTETVFDCEFCPFRPDICASSSYDGTIRLWNTTKMECETVLTAKGIIYGLSWHPYKQQIAGSMASGEIWIWDSENNSILKTINHHKDVAYRVAWNRMDPSLIASSSKDKTCVVFREDGKLLKRYRHPLPVFGVDWNPIDSQLLATGCHDYKVRVFNVQNMVDVALKELTGHEASVFNVKWHPLNKNLLLSGSNDKTVRVWNVERNDCTVLRGHTNNVRAVGWSNEMPHIALSGGWDGTIRVWDTNNGTCLHVVNDHHADVYGLSAHPQRPFFFASSSRDSTLRFWMMESLSAPLLLKLVLGHPVSDIIADDESKANLKLHGPQSKHMTEKLRAAANDAERFTIFFDFFSSPNGTMELWDLVSSCLFSKASNASTRVPHKDSFLQVQDERIKAQISKLVAQTNLSANKRDAQLREIAASYLRIGSMKEYCDTLIQLNEWEKAIAIAPSVSIEYWKELSQKYAVRLAADESEEAVPFYIASNDIPKLINFYITRDQFDNAILSSTTAACNRYPDALAVYGSQQCAKDVIPKPAVSKDMSDTIRIAARNQYENANPVLAACHYLSINDTMSAIRMLVKGNEIVLAYAISLVFRIPMEDKICTAIAMLCAKYGYMDYALESLLTIGNKSQLVRLVTQFSGAKDDIDRFYIKAGFQNQSYYANDCTDQGVDGIYFYCLGKQYQKAASLTIAALKQLVSLERWDWSEISEVCGAMNCIDATQLEPQQKYSILALANFFGGQQALWKGYYTVAPRMFLLAFELVEVHALDIGISTAYLQFMFAVAIAHSQAKDEALRCLQNVLDKGNINAEQAKYVTQLKSKLEAGEQVVSQKDRNEIIPVASNLPYRPLTAEAALSKITTLSCKAPVFVLEDKISVISVSEAVMWFDVNPFSPLGTGAKFNPY